MARLVWFVLKDGRSVIAGCDFATRDSLASAIAVPGRTITIASDDGVQQIPGSAIREFVVFDSRSAVLQSSAICRLLPL